MKYQPAITLRAAKPCLSPVTVRQNALQQLTSLMQPITEFSRLTQRIGGDIIINDMRLDVRITSS